MKLTGKCKEAFLNYVFKNNNVLDTSNKLYLNALIIDFFDSVGLRIGIAYFNVCKGYFEYRIHYNGIVGTGTTRQEAINAAIEKANVIYNESKL